MLIVDLAKFRLALDVLGTNLEEELMLNGARRAFTACAGRGSGAGKPGRDAAFAASPTLLGWGNSGELIIVTSKVASSDTWVLASELEWAFHNSRDVMVNPANLVVYIQMALVSYLACPSKRDAPYCPPERACVRLEKGAACKGLRPAF